jgi:uncharacterized membrane protein
MEAQLNRLIPARYQPLARALLLSNLVSVVLFAIRVFGADSFRFGFMFWNLLLGAVPLVLAICLLKSLVKRTWRSWQNVGLTILWLGFLPNSFYILTDYIHIHLTGEINILFDVVLFFSCIFNAYVFGYWSLYLVHRELLRRLKPQQANLTVVAILFMCSFAIYLGRFQRWNSWDVIAHPFGLLFDISDRLANPVAHPQLITTTLTFFMLLGSIYWVILQFVRVLRGHDR